MIGFAIGCLIFAMVARYLTKQQSQVQVITVIPVILVQQPLDPHDADWQAWSAEIKTD